MTIPDSDDEPDILNHSEPENFPENSQSITIRCQVKGWTETIRIPIEATIKYLKVTILLRVTIKPLYRKKYPDVQLLNYPELKKNLWQKKIILVVFWLNFNFLLFL